MGYDEGGFGEIILSSFGSPLLPIVYGPPPTLIQQFSVLNESAAVAYPSNNTLGNLLVIATIAANSPSSTLPTPPPTVTDTQTNTWTVISSALAQSPTGGPLFAQSLTFAYCPSCKAGANSVTANWGTVSHSHMCIWEIHGVSILDQVAIGNGASGTAFSTASITTTGSGIALVHFATNDNSPSGFVPGTGWTGVTNTNAFNSDEYQIYSSPVSITGTVTGTGSTGTWEGSMVSFK